MRIFGDNRRVTTIAVRAIRITSCFYFPLGIIYVVRSICNGAGDVLYPLINGYAEIFGRIGFALILIRIPFVGEWAVWVTAGLTWTFTALASAVRYKQKRWMNLK